MKSKSLHSICRWTFNAGKGGFVPGNIRPSWSAGAFDTEDFVRIIKDKIKNRLPENIELGVELHYNSEIDEDNAQRVSDALKSAEIYLAMITPGAHSHFGYGGIASLCKNERESAEKLGEKTIDLAYGVLKKNWHPDPDKCPTFVLWNGSWGYDIASPCIKEMYANLKESTAKLCKHEEKKGGQLYIGIEPKPNEGHPAMLIPTVASAILLWRRIEEEYKIDRRKKGVNKEFGHSEMIGLDSVYDTVEEIDNASLVHVHANSQGYNDGIILGGPGKFDVDHGTRINGINIAIARLILDAGFNRWKGHDMQPRAYDNDEQAIDRVIRSVLSWEACEISALKMDKKLLLKYLRAREAAKAEDLIRDAVIEAYHTFDRLYK